MANILPVSDSVSYTHLDVYKRQALLGGLLPALKAAKLEPALALR